MFERELRELSFVPRWTIVRRIKEQSVAEHSYYVALYAGQIADLVEWPGNRAALLDMALRHDLDEVFLSDIPGPSKRAIVDELNASRFVDKELSRRFGKDYHTHGKAEGDEWLQITAIIKVADLLEGVLWMATEQQLGNRSLSKVLEENYDRLVKAWHYMCDQLNLLPNTRIKGRTLLDISFAQHNSEQSVIVTG